MASILQTASLRIVTGALLTALPAVSLAQSVPAQQVQNPSSSSSSGQSAPPPQPRSAVRAPQVEAGGSGITLETSEPLFDLAVALNACGYDADLNSSSPVRRRVRDQINEELTASAPARDSRDAVCAYVREHTLADPGLNLAQYVSLSLYLTPLPELTTAVDQTEMPPDSLQVVNILPLLRTFADTLQLHALWVEHRSEYEALTNQIHMPMTRSVLDTDIFLHMPVSSYDGRRFMVLLEPMLSPSTINARIYASDYIVVASPSVASDGTATVRMDDIRHTYLHYMVEPLIYSKASSMERLQPLLRSVQDAPLDFVHKTDIVALLTECLIKAVEAQLMDVGIPRPMRPDAIRQRVEMEQYESARSAYDKQAEIVRRQAVEKDMRQGWVLTEYFYNQLGPMERESISLKDQIGPMIYGMDVEHERHHDEQIAFYPPGSPELNGSSDIVRRVATPPTGLNLAEMKLAQGDTEAAEELANKALSDPKGDHAQANYVLARAELMQREPEDAIGHFGEVLKLTKDPRTVAWTHIYLGRLYDVRSERPKALEEYKAALSTRDSRPDTKTAAEAGLKKPLALPQREAMPSQDDDKEPLDPSGKAEKEAYRPSHP